MPRGRADDIEVPGDETKTVVGQVERRGLLDPVWVRLGQISSVESRHTSSQSTVACNASNAFLAAPRTLRTSSQNRNFVSRNLCRVEVIVGTWDGFMSTPTRCVCHEIHAYRKMGSMYSSTLSFKSLTSEFAIPSGSRHMFFSSVRFIRRKQPISSPGW